MKSTFRNFLIIFAIGIFFVFSPKHGAGQVVNVSFQVFYDDLSPYGQWVDYRDYGYCWVPMAGPDFFPYASNGHWVLTIYGWTWISHYNWGWAPFHYGRWAYDDYYGWFWVPGNVWGPAWVVWRSSPASYGWCPLGPNISIDIVFGNTYYTPPEQWTFMPNQYMGRDDINNYYGPRKNSQEFINNSTVINNTYVDNSTHNTYITGPKKEDVQKATGAPIRSVEIKENSKPGQTLENNQLKIYRPVISETANINAKPAKIAERKDVKPISERPIVNQKDVEAPSKKPLNKELLQKNQTNPKSTQKETQQKQNLPPANKGEQVPVQQKKQHEVPKQPDKGNPKSSQKNGQQKQNIPINTNEKQVPLEQKKQTENAPQQENIKPKTTQKEFQQVQNVPNENKERPAPVQPIKQPDKAPPPVPIQKDKQERPKQERTIEQKTNEKPKLQTVPRKEKTKSTSTSTITPD